MIAVNILNTIPKPKVIAKPLIGPLPKKNNTTAAIIVVTFESRIVAKALENPESIAFLKVLPLRNSSLNLSKIKTLASTAIPIDKIIPAIPGRVKVASNNFNENNKTTVCGNWINS